MTEPLDLDRLEALQKVAAYDGNGPLCYATPTERGLLDALPALIAEVRQARAWAGGEYLCPVCQADLEPGDTSLRDLRFSGAGYAYAEIRCPQCSQALGITEWESAGKYISSFRYDVRAAHP